jgi:hypothetical protein
MGETVHDAVREAVANDVGDGWWQCCVFVVDASAEPYLKSVSGRHRGALADVV